MSDSPRKLLLERWGITESDLTTLVDMNPSLRGMLVGYVAELKLRQRLLDASPDVEDIGKADDHDRGGKGDLSIRYRGHIVRVECKSLQTNSVRVIGALNDISVKRTAKAQVDASDCREVKLPNGATLQTTCLRAGEFDLLAVNCFAFGLGWKFAFAKNLDLPRSSFKRYSKYQRRHLLASLVSVSWPPEPPFYSDPLDVLERIVADRGERRSRRR